MKIIRFDGPIGKNNFRTGSFKLHMDDGSIFEMYSTVPHNCSLKEQQEILQQKYDAKRAAATLGRMGGESTSEAKKAASRENGKKGGRPKKNKGEIKLTSLQKMRLEKSGQTIARNYSEGFAKTCNRETMDIKHVIKKAVQYGFNAAIKAVEDIEE